MLTSYENFSVKSFNGNDHLSNSVTLTKDIDLRYLYVDDTNPTLGARSSFFGSYWYCIGKTFISRGKFEYTLKRDVFQTLDILLANNNTQITQSEQLTAVNNRWLNEDAYIERGIATNGLRYRKDNLPLNKIKVAQYNIVPRTPVIGIFYNQRLDTNKIAENFNLVGQINRVGIPDFTESSITVGTANYIDVDNLGQLNYVTPTYGFTTKTVTYYNTRSMRFNTNLDNTDTIVPYAPGQSFTINGGATLKNITSSINGIIYTTSDFNAFKTAFKDYRVSRADLTSGILDITGQQAYSTISNKLGIIKVGNNFYKREIVGTTYINVDLIPIVDSKLNKSLGMNDTLWKYDKNANGTMPNAQVNIACTSYQIKTEQISVYSSNIERKIAAKTEYPLLTNSPIKCMLIEFNDDNMKWATSVTQMPEVVSAQIIKYPLQSWLSNMSKQDVGDDINSLSISEDEVAFTHTLSTPLGAGNKEYSVARISSGSFMNSLEIDLYQNDGLDKFDISYRVKPMGTTYYIIPHYKGMYGTNYLDKRGLIEQEDLLITDMNDEWLNAQYSNRNMFNSFNRQQESLELQQTWEQKSAAYELKMSKHEAIAAQGQTWANYTGNLPLIGGIANTIGMAHGAAGKGSVYKDVMEGANLDYQMGKELRQDAYNLQKDLFNFGVGNIKALSPTISRLDSLDTKTVFGFIIELFETSQTEKELVDNYKIWNGEPIDAQGKFINYIDFTKKHLIKGSLVKSTYPPYIVKEINEALKGGIYVV